jgi:hypothetical protein
VLSSINEWQVWEKIAIEENQYTPEYGTKGIFSKDVETHEQVEET